MTMLKNNTTPKKLAILLTLPSLGGLELNLLKFAAYRLRHNYPTKLILSIGSAATQWAIQENIPFTTIGKAKKYFSLKAIFQLNKVLHQNNIDTIFISSSQDLDMVAWTKFHFLKQKHLFVYFYQQMQLGVSKKDIYHTWKFSTINSWIAPLPWLKSEVLSKTKIDATKISIIPLCLDCNEFLKNFNSVDKLHLRANYSLPLDSPIFGIAGRIDPGKGQLDVVRAFAKISPKFPKTRLCLIGSATLNDLNAQEYENLINDEIKLLKIENKVLRIPHLHEPSKIYALIDILIVASVKETFGMVTVEGLLANLIIIGANSGGTPDILGLGQYGLLYNPGSVEDLTDKMMDAITNYETLKNQNLKKDFAQEYDFKKLNSFLSLKSDNT